MTATITSPRLDAEAVRHKPTVFIVDDDPDVRRTVVLLARSVDLKAEQYTGAQEFLEAYDDSRAGCLVVDVRMPGMSGLELQKELVERAIELPIIFISAYGEISNATAAMRAGAVDFLSKPYSPHLLLERINEAMAIDEQRRAVKARRQDLEARIENLTNREREIMSLLARGDSTKVIAARLGISSKTVDNHRAKILEKMVVDNVAQLTRLLAPLTEATDGEDQL